MKPEVWYFAASDLRIARLSVNTDIEYDLWAAAYHIQQSIKGSLRSYLKVHNILCVGVHDIKTLLTLLPEDHEGISDTALALVEDKVETLAAWDYDVAPAEEYPLMRDQVLRYWATAKKLHSEVGEYLTVREVGATTSKKKGLIELNLGGGH